MSYSGVYGLGQVFRRPNGSSMLLPCARYCKTRLCLSDFTLYICELYPTKLL
jgi:hypothetical protein